MAAAGRRGRDGGGKRLTIHYPLRRRRRANRLVEGRDLGRPASALDADDFQAVAKHNVADAFDDQHPAIRTRSEEHTSELQSLMRLSYAVFLLKKKKTKTTK